MKKTGPKILGICGFKKSGKTSLIEKMLAELARQNLRVGVIKRQNEPVQTDQPGTDTYRFYQAGASVLGWDGQTLFIKRRHQQYLSVQEALKLMHQDFDLVLVEGFKESDIPKIWLLSQDETAPPKEITNIIAVLKWSQDRPTRALNLLREQLII
ncbi:molybdopterin-guanine dinucleotide biosynthesis protein B [Planctomycetota bacterium]